MYDKTYASSDYKRYNNALFHSDYIPIKAGRSYNSNAYTGSNNIATILWCDSNKDLLLDSSVYTTNINANFTAPDNAIYAIIQVNLLSQSDLSEVYFYDSIINEFKDNHKEDIIVYSSNQVLFDMEKLQLFSIKQTGRVIIKIGNTTYEFQLPYQLELYAENDSPYFLYLDIKNNKLFLTHRTFEDKNIIFIKNLSILPNILQAKDLTTFNFATSANTPFTVDLINKKYIINLPSLSYFVYSYSHFELPVYDNIEIPFAAPRHNVLYYNLNTRTFESLAKYYNEYTHKILLIDCNNGNIYSKVPYKKLSDRVWEFKNIICFGDSITWYDGNAYNWGKFNGQIAIGYESYLRSELLMKCTNHGHSGNTSVQIMEYIYNGSIDFSNYDYVTLTAGANDERHNIPLGTIQPIGSTFDANTYIGSFQKAIEYILNQNQACRIILCTPIRGWIYAPAGFDFDTGTAPTSGTYEITDKWANALIELGKVYGIPVCDWYNKCGFNILNRNTYMNDPEPVEAGGTNTLYSLHPTPAGYKRMADLLIHTIENLY